MQYRYYADSTTKVVKIHKIDCVHVRPVDNMTWFGDFNCLYDAFSDMTRHGYHAPVYGWNLCGICRP